MKRSIFAITLLSALCACSNSKENSTNSNTTETDTVCYDYSYEPTSEVVIDKEQSNPVENEVSQPSAVTTAKPMIMDPAEDAYEEARALAEEDAMNGTRMHEGDDYDPDYADDYDEGYDDY